MKTVKRFNVRLMLAILAGILLVVLVVALVHGVQVRRNAQGLADLARLKVKEGKAGEAIMLYARYLQFRPSDAVAQGEYARLMLARAEGPNASRGDRAMAYDAVESAVSKNPRDRELRATLADLMLRMGRFGAAGEQLDILLGSGGPSPADGTASPPEEDRDALTLLRARAYLGTANYRESAALLAGICGFDLETGAFSSDQAAAEQAAADTGDPVVFQASVFLSALLDEKLRSPAAARAVLDHLVETHPDDFRGWLARANWHRSRDDFLAAAADLAKARALAPADAGVLFTSFEIAVSQRRFADAERLILEGRRLFPADERVFRGIAAVAARQGDLERATAVLREALTKKLNDHSRIGQMLVDLLLQQRRPEEAEAALAAHAEKYGADGPEAGLLEARLLLAQRRWLPAKKKLEEIRPRVASSTQMTNEVDLYLGQCHEQLGEFDQQLAANRRVLSEDHTSIAARIGAAAALATTGRPDEALVEYESIASSLPTDQLAATPQVWQPLLQLRVAEQMKRPDADRDWSRSEALLDLLEQSPAVSSTQLALLKSDALLRRGDVQGAEKLLREQRAAEPENPQITAALVTLTLRTQGPAAARQLVAAAPAEIVDSPIVMVAEAQAAARMPREDSAPLFAAIEARVGRLSDDAAAQVLANIGAIQRSAGNTAEAERLWQEALAKRPEDLQILTALQELACDLGQLDRATETAGKICRLSGETSPQGRVARAATLVLAARQQLARATEDRGAGSGGPSPPAAEADQLTPAYNLLVEAENERPGWVRTQKLFADIAILRGDPSLAIERLQRALRLNAADPALLRNLLSLLYLSNRLAEAQQTLAKLGPEGVSGMERLSAEIELSTGRFDDAVAFAERSLDSTDKASAADLIWFGQLLARAGKGERAADVLRQAVDTDPKRPEGWLALLSVQFATGQRRYAERTLEQAHAALDPPMQQMVMAQGCEMLGRIDDAERYFREALAADRGSAAAARSLASFLVRRGRLTAARDELREIISADASDAPDAAGTRAWARRTLAVLLAQSGGFREMEEALAILEQNATAGTPSAEDVSLMIGILGNRPEPGNWRRAIDLFDRLATMQPLSTAQRIQHVQLLERCGRWSEGRDDLVAIVSQPNAPVAVQSLLVEKLIQHGERDAARLWLKKLGEQAPDTPTVLALQAKLALADDDRATAAEAARKLMPDTTPAPAPEHIGAVATLLESLGFTKAAEKVFEKYAAATKAGALARAAFLGRQRRPDEALDTLEQQWDRLPLQPLLQTAMQVLRSQGTNASPDQRRRVADWFVKADRQDPDSPPLKLLLADLHALDGRDDEAVAIYRGLLARQDLLPTQSAVVANNLAFLLAQPATAAEAERLIDHAIAELGPNPDVLDTRGCVLLAAGKTGEAVAALQDAVLAPSAVKYLHLACALAANRQEHEARKALAEARKLGLDPLTLSADDRLRLTSLESVIGG